MYRERRHQLSHQLAHRPASEKHTDSRQAARRTEALLVIALTRPVTRATLDCFAASTSAELSRGRDRLLAVHALLLIPLLPLPWASNACSLARLKLCPLSLACSLKVAPLLRVPLCQGRSRSALRLQQRLQRHRPPVTWVRPPFRRHFPAVRGAARRLRKQAWTHSQLAAARFTSCSARSLRAAVRRCSLPSPMPLGGGRWLHRGQVVHWLLGDDALGRRDLLEGGAVGLCERGHAAAHACQFSV